MQNSSLQFFSSPYFRVGLGLFISGLTLFWVFREVDLWVAWEVFQNANWNFIGLGICSVCLNNIGKSLRWRFLLGDSGRNIGHLLLLKTTLSGQLMNIVLPGRIGDLVRVMMLGSYLSKAIVVGSIVIEKIIELLAFALLFFISFIILPLPSWLENSSLTWFRIAVIGGILLIGGVAFHQKIAALIVQLVGGLPTSVRSWFTPRIERGLASIETLREKNTLFVIIFLTCIVWGTAILNNYLSMKAIGIQLPIAVSVILLIGLQAGISTSASPGAIGVFEYICILVLTYFGVDNTLALGYGLLLHVLVFAPQLIGGVWAIWGWKSSQLVK